MDAVFAHPCLCSFLLNGARHRSSWFRQQAECLQKSPTPKPALVSLIKGRKMICCITSNYKTSISDAKCTYFFKDTMLLVYSLQFAVLEALAVSWELAAQGDARGQILLTFIEVLLVTGS